MQRRVLLGAGAVLLLAAGFLVVRNATRHEATKQLDLGIDQLLARLPPGYTVRHGTTGFNALTSALTVSDLVVMHDGATLWTADRVTVSGADGPALQDVFDPAQYPGGHPKWTDRRLLIADGSAEGIHFVASDPRRPDIVIRHASLHRLSGHPFLLPPTPENRVKPEFAADVALTLALDSLRETDAVIKVMTPYKGAPYPPPGAPDAEANRPAQGTGTITLGSYAISDYDGGKIGSAEINNVGAEYTRADRGAVFHMSLASADIKNADFRPFLTGVRQTGRAGRGELSKLGYDSVGVTGFVFDVAHGPHIALADLRAQRTKSDNGDTGGRGQVHGLTLALGQTPLPPRQAPAIAAFGLNAITTDIDGTSAKTSANEARINEDIVLRDLATLHLDGDFAGYDAALVSPGHPFAAIQATTIEKARVVYEDHSLVNRVLAAFAAQMHTTADVLRAQAAMPLVTLGLMIPQQPDIADQLTKFINHPHNLTVTMNPPQKVTLGAVAESSPPARIQMLGLHISAD